MQRRMFAGLMAGVAVALTLAAPVGAQVITPPQAQTVTVEPGVYLPGHGGVRIEDTLIVTDGAPELLTLTSKELLVL